jgi:outer membrane biosynthesis protein TonB
MSVLVHNGAMRAWTVIPAACLCAAALAACAPKTVRLDPQGPALDAPIPPAHVVVPAEEPPAAPASSPAAAGVKPVPRTNRTPQRTPPAKTDKPAKAADKTDKPDPAPPAPAKPAEDTTQPAAATLQTTANVDEEERKIRAVLSRATTDLGQVDPRTLTADRKSQYDTAKRFAEQAEDALKDKNVVFARQLADKAATLAALLVKR